MAVLVILNNNAPGQVIPLNKPEMLIGRRQDCDVVLDPNGVSREHARIKREGDRHYINDLNARNGTKVNEKRVDPGVDWALNPGDRINICDVELVYYPVYPPEQLGGEHGPEVIDGGEDSTIHMLDASRSDVLASVIKPEVKLKAILQISRELSSNLAIDDVAPKILKTLLQIFPQAERAFLVLIKSEESGKWAFKKVFSESSQSKRPGLRTQGGPADEQRLRMSKAIIGHVIDNKRAVLSQDAGNDLNLPTSASIADLRIRSVMCSPLLTTDGEILGIIQLDTSDRRSFNQEDLDVLEAVSRQATTALQNAAMHEELVKQKEFERDLALAKTIQMRFLPQTTPQIDGFEFFAFYQAAKNVGGDYYDFIPLADGRWAIALGDVAGKGIAAALVMAKFACDARSCILTNSDPAAITEQANRMFCEAELEDRFITFSLCVLDPASKQIQYSSAGHIPIMVKRRGGAIEEFGPELGGFPLGIERDWEFTKGTIQLQPGDVVLVYSDGVPDARNAKDEPYDSENNHRLYKRVEALSAGPLAMGKAILQEIREHSGDRDQFDDTTLLVFGPVAT